MLKHWIGISTELIYTFYVCMILSAQTIDKYADSPIASQDTIKNFSNTTNSTDNT